MLKYIARVFARQFVRRIAVVIVGALFMLLPALWGGLQAHAASEYDEYIKYTEYLDNFKPCALRELSFDMTYSWGDPVISRLQDLSVNGSSQTIRDNAAEALDWFQSGSGYWVTRSAINSGDINVHIAHPDSSFAFGYKGQWVASSTTLHAQGVNVSGSPHFYTLTFVSMKANVNNCSNANQPDDKDDYLDILINGIDGTQIGRLDFAKNFQQIPSQYSSAWPNYVGTYYQTYAGSTPTFNAAFHLIASDNVSYPENYEGEIIPDIGPTPPVTGEQYAPNWTILTANNWKAEIRDYRFVTFDGIPWTCSEDGNSIQSGHEGLAPVIEWELYDENNTLIDDGILSATAHWNYQFDEYNEDRTYTIKGRYDCGGSVNFNTIGEKQFTITKTGLLKEQDFFAQCVMLEPPFIDIQACIENVFRVIEILTFNQVTLVKGLNATENCRQLVVLGHWINKPYEIVCPQFSQTVRNTITPFVTFILGLFTAMVIVRFMNNRGMS